MFVLLHIHPNFMKIIHPRKRKARFFCEDVDWAHPATMPVFDAMLLVLLEVLLADAACGAGPVFRDVFKGGSGGYASFRVSFCRIIYVSADDANILIHNLTSFGDVFQFLYRKIKSHVAFDMNPES